MYGHGARARTRIAAVPATDLIGKKTFFFFFIYPISAISLAFHRKSRFLACHYLSLTLSLVSPSIDDVGGRNSNKIARHDRLPPVNTAARTGYTLFTCVYAWGRSVSFVVPCRPPNRLSDLADKSLTMTTTDTRRGV